MFKHRANPDGTYDSICLRCFCTAVRRVKQEALESQESLHSCDPDDFLRFAPYQCKETTAKTNDAAISNSNPSNSDSSPLKFNLSAESPPKFWAS